MWLTVLTPAYHWRCVFAVPEPVWDSWQKHLGGPELKDIGGGDFEMIEPDREKPITSRTLIYVFDIDTTSTETPRPIVVRKIVSTDADALSHYALKVAPQHAPRAGRFGRQASRQHTQPAAQVVA